MKKCPSCQKTFDDNLKFCQSDGTALVTVAEEPSDDPYKTMVAGDFKLPEESVEAPEQKPAVPEMAADVVAEAEPDNEAVLEIPEADSASDPMKTLVVSGSSTSDNIKIPDLPEQEKTADVEKAGEPAEAVKPKKSKGSVPKAKAPAAPSVEANAPEPTPAPPPKGSPPDKEAETMMAPNIPQFSEPDIKPPDLSAENKDAKPKAASPSGNLPKAEPNSGELPKPASPKSPQTPIPSPFEDSMPPGVLAPETPPFEIPVAKNPKPLNKEAAAPPASPFADPNEPVSPSGTEEWDVGSKPVAKSTGMSAPVGNAGGADPFGNNAIAGIGGSSGDDSALSADAEGENKTLAIVSLVTGILSILCCFSIITGPVALITGFMAKGKINDDSAAYGGGTFATIGMILGAIGIVLFIILMILQLLPLLTR